MGTNCLGKDIKGVVMKKRELEDYRLFVSNDYDLLVRIQENRGLSYGELAYIEELDYKGLKDLEEEIGTEIERIINCLKERGLTIE